jgi:hypothetical protein
MERNDFRRTLMHSMSIIDRKGIPEFQAKSATVTNVRYLVYEGEIRIEIERHFALKTFFKKRIHRLSPINLNSGSAGKVGSATHRTYSNESRAQSVMVGFSKTLDTVEKRSEAMRIMCEKWFLDGEPFGYLISDKMWRNELYPIYTHRKSIIWVLFCRMMTDACSG